MPRPKIAFVVGHSNWGKSETLRALTSGNPFKRSVTISDIKFFVRRRSNDDKPRSFIDRMKSFDPIDWPYIVAALCPDFDRPHKGTLDVLQTMRSKGYGLYFWVLEEQYGTKETIKRDEVSKLRDFGKVEIYAGQAQALTRAKHFKSFVINTVVA